ncbi:hypothetical protein HMPREF1140_1069 [Lachnoanaerobaculum sp. ICM7]|uniref:hypothetical protein n=1 Tax=Lachnoanaerobaculum sp. ICM7 TaxID=936594 RepID=UPI00027A671F|nr:hypothetical protein [Lachnoanaerobaculum sp. ICM7]EJP23742.1 hypothetical protein HMPREF1140_1069 [Lachnoanaerobaculum sp. ICM7]
MRKKNKLRLSILFTLFFIIIFITVLIFFVLPKFDFMYISADKHWQKEKIGDVDEKTGGTEKEKVKQGTNGIYFVYKDKLMYMDEANEQVREMCKLQSGIIGIIVKDDTVFFRKRDEYDYGFYKVDLSGKIVKLFDASGTSSIEGENIYILDGEPSLRKYDFNGRKIFENKVKSGFISSGMIFDNYIFFIRYNFDISDDGVEVSIPKYYLFDANKINYKTRKLKLSRYYMQPEAGNTYWKEDVIPYDSVAKEVDKTVREGEIFDDTTEKNLDDYELQSVELLPWSFSEVQDGYIYLYGEQRVTYRDKNYKEKMSVIKEGWESEKIKKVTYTTIARVLCRINIEDIKDTSEDTYINYELVCYDLNKNWGGFIINNKNAYVLKEDEYFDSSKEDRNIYVYSMDVDTGLYKEIYRKERFFIGNYYSEMFVTDKYIFIYEGSEYGVKKCITRIDRDGNNPILVMDENGEVVMQALEK